MSESQVTLIFGDPYRCERALAARHTAILAKYPDTERHTLFGDELDMPSLRVELQSTPLFALGRHFVVRHIDAIKDVKRFAALVKRELPPSTFLTLLAGELKESNPIVKAVKACGSVQALPRAKGKGLERAASKILTEHGLNLTQEALKELLTRSGGDLLVILQEVGKLHAFSPKEVIDEISIKRLSFTAGEGSIYPFLDRVGEQNLKAALATLATIHEDPGRIFSALLRHLTRVLMVRVLLDQGFTATKMATMIASPGWLVRRLISQAKAHPVQRLTATLDLGIKLDLKVKSGGIRPADALLKLILAVTTPAPPAPEYARRSQPSRATID